MGLCLGLSCRICHDGTRKGGGPCPSSTANRVELKVFDHNPRGIHVYEKCGFKLEGRHREESWRHGRYRDVLTYAILRREWQEEAPARHR